MSNRLMYSHWPRSLTSTGSLATVTVLIMSVNLHPVKHHFKRVKATSGIERIWRVAAEA